MCRSAQQVEEVHHCLYDCPICCSIPVPAEICRCLLQPFRLEWLLHMKQRSAWYVLHDQHAGAALHLVSHLCPLLANLQGRRMTLLPLGCSRSLQGMTNVKQADQWIAHLPSFCQSAGTPHSTPSTPLQLLSAGVVSKCWVCVCVNSTAGLQSVAHVRAQLCCCQQCT